MPTLESTLEQMQADGADQYRALVLRTADDQPATPAEIREVLAASGMTLDQLSSDVGRLRERRRAVESLATARANREQAEALQKDLQSVRQQQRELHAAYLQSAAPLDRRASELEEKARGLDRQAHWLTSQATPALCRTADPRVKARIGELQRELESQRGTSRHFVLLAEQVTGPGGRRMTRAELAEALESAEASLMVTPVANAPRREQLESEARDLRHAISAIDAYQRDADAARAQANETAEEISRLERSLYDWRTVEI